MSTSRSVHCRTLADTAQVAQWLSRHEQRSVWLLHGGLGSGKTTFVRSVLWALGYRRLVTSPTFILRRDYALRGPHWKRLVHIDAYRLRDNQEIAALDLLSVLQEPDTLVVIEWPERLRGWPWANALRIDFSYAKPGRLIALGWEDGA